MVSISLILLGVALVIILLCAGVSALRGFSKTALRTATLILSALGAIVTCLILKAQLPNAEEFVALAQNNMEAVRQGLGSEAAEMLETVMEFSTVSPTLVELVIQLVGALLAPILCLIFYFLFSFITWIIYCILKLVLRKPLKDLNQLIPLSRLCAAGVGVVEGIIIVSMLFLPLAGYLTVLEPTLNGLVEQNVMDAEDPDTQTVLEIVDEFEAAPALKIHRTLGGDAVAGLLMSMKVADQRVNLEEELDPVLGLLMNIAELVETEMQNYGEREAELIRSIGTTFTQSKLLAPIVGDILYGATDAWLNGEEFLGTEKPDMGEASDLFAPFVDTMLEILHDDAKNSEQLGLDIQTLADVISILVDNRVMANLENTEDMLATLGGEGVVESMITALGENQSMKRLIPEVTNLGIRAIGQILNIPQDVDAVYGDFMGDVADSLNEISHMPKDQQVSALTDRLTTAFDDAGVAIDREILDFYSASMISDLVEKKDGEVTAEDVKAFFLIYAENASAETPSVSSGRPAMETLGSVSDPYAGTVYEGMTAEERRQSATAILAQLCGTLSTLNPSDADYTERAQTAVLAAFTRILGEDHEALAALKETELKNGVSPETIQNTTALRSPEELEGVTTVVTMDQLLVDTKAAADALDAAGVQKEAEAIAAIFGSASSFGDGSLDLTSLAATLGSVLDSMSATDSFGKEKTANLFTAVLQSELVRESTGLTMEMATQMGQKAGEGDTNYTQTMTAVAGTVGLAEKLGNGEDIPEEDLVELIRNITPQTAGMLEIYMNEERAKDMGMPEENAGTFSELMIAIFSYMGREDLEDYDAEAKGLNLVLNMVIAAEESDDDELFSAEGSDNGVLPHQDEFVDTIMGSESVCYALVEVLTDGSKVTTMDGLGMDKLNEQDKASLETAIRSHMSAHPEKDALAYKALGSLFGITIQ